MDPMQRRTIVWAAYAIAAILFVFFFGRQAWEWATWQPSKGAIDLGFLRITSRPPFPNDVRSVVLGLITPILLVAGGRMVAQQGGGR